MLSFYFMVYFFYVYFDCERMLFTHFLCCPSHLMMSNTFRFIHSLDVGCESFCSCQENVQNICSVVNHKLFTQSVCGNSQFVRVDFALNSRSSRRFVYQSVCNWALETESWDVLWIVIAFDFHLQLGKRFFCLRSVCVFGWATRTKHVHINNHSTQNRWRENIFSAHTHTDATQACP